MGQFAQKYTRDQKDAVASYWLDRRVRPAARICRLAEAGEIEHEGKRLPSFRISEAMVRHEGARLRKQRHGELRTQLAAVTPRDAIEALRKRLVSAVDHEMARVEREQERGPKNAEPVDGLRISRLAAAVDRIAKLPLRDEAIPLPTGHRREAAKATTPLGASILNAAVGGQASEPSPTGLEPASEPNEPPDPNEQVDDLDAWIASETQGLTAHAVTVRPPR